MFSPDNFQDGRFLITERLVKIAKLPEKIELEVNKEYYDRDTVPPVSCSHFL